MQIISLTLLLYLVLFLLFLSWVDYEFRCFNLKIILAHYPIVIMLALGLGLKLPEIIFGFLLLFAVFYFIQLFMGSENVVIVGGLDILVAPLFTTIFGYYSFSYLIAFLLVTLIIGYINPLSRLLKGKYYEDYPDRMPMIPIMFISFLLTFVLVYVL